MFLVQDNQEGRSYTVEEQKEVFVVFILDGGGRVTDPGQ